MYYPNAPEEFSKIESQIMRYFIYFMHLYNLGYVQGPPR